MANPGFPVWGRGPVGGGGMDLQGGRFSVKMFVKMKELGFLGEGRALGTPPRSANDYFLCSLNSNIR